MASRSITIIEILKAIFKRKYIVLSITILGFIGSIFYSLSIQNTYRSTSVLVPIETDSNMLQSSNFSSLAGIAGINFNNPTSNVDEAIASIQSKDFFKNYFYGEIFLPNLIGYKKWELEQGFMIYDSEIYDVENKLWVRKVSFPKKIMPSAQEAHEAFLDHLEISKDNKTGFVNISITHISPQIAHDWVTKIIHSINEDFRAKEKALVQESLSFLNNKYNQTSFTEVKESIASLIEEQTKKLMLAEVNTDYVFSILESPVIPEKKYAPSRMSLVVSFSIFSFFIGIVVAIFSHFSLPGLRRN